MKFLRKMKDGGLDSTVTGYWLIEAKGLFSIVLLKFEGKSREAFHTHAFDAISWLLSGSLTETVKLTRRTTYNRYYKPSLKPIKTLKNRFHKVSSDGTSWVLSFRGPWDKTWIEESGGETYTLKQGRERV